MIGRRRLSEKRWTWLSGRFSKVSRISGASFKRLSVGESRTLDMPRCLVRSAWLAQVPCLRMSLRMTACFTGLTTGIVGILWVAVGSVSAGSMGDTKKSPWCSLERSIQKARSKKFVNLSNVGSHNLLQANRLGSFSVVQAPDLRRCARRSTGIVAAVRVSDLRNRLR